jgi:hypothetical protein
MYRFYRISFFCGMKGGGVDSPTKKNDLSRNQKKNHCPQRAVTPVTMTMVVFVKALLFTGVTLVLEHLD